MASWKLATFVVAIMIFLTWVKGQPAGVTNPSRGLINQTGTNVTVLVNETLGFGGNLTIPGAGNVSASNSSTSVSGNITLTNSSASAVNTSGSTQPVVITVNGTDGQPTTAVPITNLTAITSAPGNNATTLPSVFILATTVGPAATTLPAVPVTAPLNVPVVTPATSGPAAAATVAAAPATNTTTLSPVKIDININVINRPTESPAVTQAATAAPTVATLPPAVTFPPFAPVTNPTIPVTAPINVATFGPVRPIPTGPVQPPPEPVTVLTNAPVQTIPTVPILQPTPSFIPVTPATNFPIPPLPTLPIPQPTSASVTIPPFPTPPVLQPTSPFAPVTVPTNAIPTAPVTQPTQFMVPVTVPPVQTPISTAPTMAPVGQPTIPTIVNPSIPAARNGSQVICFSVPDSVLSQLIPLLAGLGLGVPGATTSAPVFPQTAPTYPMSPLYNPVTQPPQPQPPITNSPPLATTGPYFPTAVYPTLGPYGTGSYGGFRPSSSYDNNVITPGGQTNNNAYSSNPYPALQSPLQLAQPAGVIPYYTFAPSSQLGNAVDPIQNSSLTNTVTFPSATTQTPWINNNPYAVAGAAGSGYGLNNSPIVASSSPVYGTMPSRQPYPTSNYYGQSPSSSGYSYGNAAFPAIVSSPSGYQSTFVRPLASPVASPSLANPIPVPAPRQINLSQPDICQAGLIPDAVTITADGLMHVFVGRNVFRIDQQDRSAVQAGDISQFWPGIPADVIRISSANTRQDGTTFLFTDDRYWKFDRQYRMANDSPRSLSIGFPGMVEADAVFQAPSTSEDMIFVKGPTYYLYNHKRFPPYRGPFEVRAWGVKLSSGKVDAAYNEGGNVILISGEEMFQMSTQTNLGNGAPSFTISPGFPRPFRSLFNCA